MDDLEMTKLCAIASGSEVMYTKDAGIFIVTSDKPPEWSGCSYGKSAIEYDPLHNDAQAMALARKFMLDVDFFVCSVSTPPSARNHFVTYCDESVNKAIVECVAKMQVDSPSAGDSGTPLVERLEFIANNTHQVIPEEIEEVCDLAARALSAREHSLDGEKDTKLLACFTPDKQMAPGFEVEFWNLTMVRCKGDVVLTVRLPSKFSHYIQNDGRMAVWHPGAVSSVRFTRESWRALVAHIADADKVFSACDELDSMM